MYISHKYGTRNARSAEDPQFRNTCNVNSQDQNHDRSRTKRPPPPRPPPPLQKKRIRMNCCLVCNKVFFAEKSQSQSEESSVIGFITLCNVLQVPSFKEFTPETNPLCTECVSKVDEYLKMQLQIKELLEKLGEMRKMLGIQLVDNYANTPSTLRNYPVKTKIYNIWHAKLNPKPVKSKQKAPTNQTESEDVQQDKVQIDNAPVIPARTKSTADQDLMLTQQQVGNENQESSNYTILDISHSVSSASNHGGASAANSIVADNNENSNLSMECPTPGSPPIFDDDGPVSDHADDDVYVRNLTEETETRRVTDNTTADNDTLTSLKTENSMPTFENQAVVSGGNPNGDLIASVQQTPWIDRRRFKPALGNQRRSHPCKFCGKLFPAVFSLQLHERTHTGERPFACSICDRRFAAKAAMQKHELTHDKSRYEGVPQYECDLCGRKYHLERSLYTHKRDHMGIKRIKRRKPKPKNPLAPPRKKPVKDPNALPKPKKKPAVKKEGQPRRSRKKVKVVKLDEHGNPIPEKPRLIRRKRSPKPPSNRPKRIFLFPRRKPGTPKVAICEFCGKDCKEYYRLIEHKRMHTGEKPLKCPFPECPKQFASKANMYKHMKTHDKTRFEGPPPHVCDHCGKGFYILGTLYHHRRKKHLGLEKMYIKRRQEKYLKPSKCDVCGLVCKSFYSLYHHKALHGEPKFKCEICEKPFFRVSEIPDHVKSHEPTYMYNRYFRLKCSACPSEHLGFPSKLSIREHWAVAHKDEALPEVYKKPPKPKRPIVPGKYVCTLCPETNRPRYDHYSSFYKHRKSFHSGKNKKWKPRVSGGAQRTKRKDSSEDELSTSGNSSEEDIDFENDVKTAVENTPVRRSSRKVRSRNSFVANLLEESEPESENYTPPKTSSRRVRFAVGLRGSIRREVASPAKNKERTKTHRNTSNRKNDVSKMTNSDINILLGGREVRLVLHRVEIEDPLGNTERYSEPAFASPTVANKSSKNVARRSGRPLGKPNVSDTTLDYYSMSIERNTIRLSENETVITEGQQNPTSESPTPEVKDEPESVMSDDETYQSIPIIQAAPKRPNFSSPMIIHNPLSKNKATNSIIISVQGPSPTQGSGNGTNESDKVTNEDAHEEESASDNENETVLGF